MCVCVDQYVFDLCLVCAQFAGLYIKYTDSVLTTEIELFKCTQKSTDHKRGGGERGLSCLHKSCNIKKEKKEIVNQSILFLWFFLRY